MVARRRWGYLLWGIAGAVIAVPELTAAVDDEKALPFTTISAMVGHLERHHTWVELVVVAAIVFAVYATVRVHPDTQAPDGGGARAARTPGGRLAVEPKPAPPRSRWEDQAAPGLFAAGALVSFAGIAVATWAASEWWDDSSHYRPAYVLYGLVGLLWIVVPSVVAFVFKTDVPFPTLFRTVRNLEDWLQAHEDWPWRLGPVLAWLVGYVVVAGLAILMLHLTLYPYPDITRILNPHG
jgi:hypothetical protein